MGQATGRRRLAILLAGVSLVAAACASTPASRPAQTIIKTQSRGGGESSTLLRLADNLASEGRFASAIPIYRRAHDQRSGDNRPLVGLGRALTALGQYEEATEVYRTALDNDARDPLALRGLGGAWIALGRPELALPLFETAVTLDGVDIEARNGMAVALDALGRHREAVTAYRQALDIAPSDIQLRNNFGLSLALAGSLEEAIPLLEEVALDGAASPRHRQNLALAYGLAGRAGAARNIAAIDLDNAAVNGNLAFFAELRAMTPDARRRAVLSGVVNPKHDTRQPANPSFTADKEVADETIARIIAPEPEPEPMPEPEPEPEPLVEIEIPPLVDPTGYAVQIAAYRKKEELMPGWRQLNSLYGDLIGHLEPRRSEKDFGDREGEPSGFFFRLNAGPLKLLSEAEAICVEIQVRGGDCWVRPPEPAEGRLPEPPTEDDVLPALNTAPQALSE
ncbi:MAG: tetratricopeptide repeat protein [Sphingomonadales bacterium]